MNYWLLFAICFSIAFIVSFVTTTTASFLMDFASWVYREVRDAYGKKVK